MSRLLWELEESGSLHLEDTGGENQEAPALRVFPRPADLSEESHSLASSDLEEGNGEGA